MKELESGNKFNSINIVDIDTAINDFNFKILNEEKLNKFDCIILDDAHLFMSREEKGKDFVSSLKPKILWATSSVLDKNLNKDLNSWLNPLVTIEKFQIRS